MAGKRLGALVVAVLLVLAAWAGRQWIDSGGEVAFGGEPSPVYCDALLADECRSSFGDRQVVIELPGRTLDRLLASRENESLVWVTADVWIEILQSERSRLGLGPLVTSVSADLAHTEVLLVGDNSLATACGEPTWSCLSDLDSGLEIGLDARDSTVGLVSQGQLVAGFLGRPTFASNDLDSTYAQWRARLGNDLTELPSSRSALNDFLTVRGKFNVVSTTAEQWESLSRDGLEAGVPSDTGRPIVVAVAYVGDAGASTTDLERSLVDGGWGSGAGTDRPTPGAGVLESLRNG